MRHVETPTGALILACAVATLVASVVFLLPEPVTLPMDDSYIHIVYGENLARTGKLEFNLGEFAGIGSTSILWVLLIAGLVSLGVGGVAAVKALGLASLLLTTACLTWLLFRWVPRILPRAPAWLPWAASVACGFSGNYIWFGLSGMETLCFLGLALLALVFYAKNNWYGVAVAAGLAVLTRLEGGALVVALLSVHFLTCPGERWRDVRRVVLPALILVVLVLPWLLYLHDKTGHWLPTSGGGKKMAHMAATEAGVGRAGALGALLEVRPVVFVGLWCAYALAWVFGLGYGYAPSERLFADVGGGGIDLWFPAAALVALVVLPLGWRGLGAGFGARRTLTEDAAGRALLAFGVWVLLHNLEYALLFPSLGTTSRYQAVNHIVLWLLPVLGLGAIRRPAWQSAMAVALFALLATNLVFWRGTYAANLRHMEGVRMQAAEWIASTPPTDRVAAFDIGALRWRSERPITDLGGLVDADFVGYQQEGRVGEFLRRHGVTYLAIPSAHSSEPAPFFDLLGFLRIKDDPTFTYTEAARFEGDYEDWRRGAGPTFNYMPAVVAYRVEYRE